MGYQIGLLLGFAVGIAAGVALLVMLLKKRVLDMHFDERQERARGVAFQYGFFTLLACGLALGFLDILHHWCDLMAGAALSACIGVTVFAVTAISRDAYLGLYEKPVKIMALFGILAIFNLGLGLRCLLIGNIVENGVLTYWVTNLMVGGMMLAVMAAYGLRCLLRRETEDGE